MKTNSWMTRLDWRTCKREEAEAIRDYFVVRWYQEYEKEHEAEVEDIAIERRYEWLRTVGCRAADRFGP